MYQAGEEKDPQEAISNLLKAFEKAKESKGHLFNIFFKFIYLFIYLSEHTDRNVELKPPPTRYSQLYCVTASLSILFMLLFTRAANFL